MRVTEHEKTHPWQAEELLQLVVGRQTYRLTYELPPRKTPAIQWVHVPGYWDLLFLADLHALGSVVLPPRVRTKT
ncbi:MAG: hypothetical protein ACREYC_18285 [Gammaproteobacteria bacterium]